MRIGRGVERFLLVNGVIGEHDLQRPQDRHDARRFQIEIIPNTVFQQADLNAAVAFCDPNPLTEITDRGRRYPTPAQTGNREQTWIIPAVYIATFD